MRQARLCARACSNAATQRRNARRTSEQRTATNHSRVFLLRIPEAEDDDRSVGLAKRCVEVATMDASVEWSGLDLRRFALYGAVGSFAVDGTLHPLELVKTRMQVCARTAPL